METKFIRFTASKILVKNINSGEYKQSNEEEPNYLLSNGKKIFRVNIMGVIVQKEKLGSITSLFIDDSSGTIVLKLFEETDNFTKIDVGSHVLIIGKVRSYNQEMYISPEICKVINPLWLEHRVKELNLIKEDVVIKEINVVEEVDGPDEEVEEDTLLPIKKITDLIKKLDSGDGVAIEEVIEKSLINDSEKIIERMLESGDIFQNSPGKIKVL